MKRALSTEEFCKQGKEGFEKLKKNKNENQKLDSGSIIDLSNYRRACAINSVLSSYNAPQYDSN